MLASDIIPKFNYLLHLLKVLESHIDLELVDKPAWFTEERLSDKAVIKTIFWEFTYNSPQSQSTLSRPGALAGTIETLKHISGINEAKDEFRKAVQTYLNTSGFTDTKHARELLSQAGYPLIRLRQVYRHIGIIPFHPKRISFTRTKHNTHRIISRQEAEERLNKVGKGDNIEWQKEILATIRDEKLVIRHDIKSLWAVNISTFKQANGHSQHSKLLTRLPIVYLHDESLPLPIVGLSRPYQRRKEISRADKSIEDAPVLPSIFAYRYLKP